SSHRLSIVGSCLRKSLTGDRFVTHNMRPIPAGLAAPRGVSRALYVLDADGELLAADAAVQAIGADEYAAVLATRSAAVHVPDVLELVHHSSLVAGAPVR